MTEPGRRVGAELAARLATATDAERRSAAAVVRRHAVDANDEQQLLSTLGLDDVDDDPDGSDDTDR